MGDGDRRAGDLELDPRRERAAERFAELADKVDAEKAKIWESVGASVDAAVRHIAAGEYEKAALLYEAVADEYRVNHFPGVADTWVHRAADCRSAARHAKRLAKKGKGRK